MPREIFVLLLIFILGIMAMSYASADDLPSLIENASEGDTIELADDYVCPDTIHITKPIAVDGKGHKLVASQSSRIFDVASNTTLRNIDFENSSYAMLWRGNGGVLKDCRFINCTGDGALDWQANGGVIINCTFINCSAPYSGGAIRCFGANCTITCSNFINCTTTQENLMFSNGGGAVYCNGENGLISNCFFTSCSSYHGGAVKGGLIHNSTFTNCSAYSGGAVSANNISNCIFTNCLADFGGAISSNSRNARASDCRFMNCSAKYSGGAVMWNVDYGQITNCSFRDCRSKNGGGGVYWDVEYSPVIDTHDGVILNCSFAGCYCEGNGCAIEWDGLNATVYDSSFVNCSLKERAIHGGRIFNCTFDGRDMKINLNVSDSTFTYANASIFINATDCEGAAVGAVITIRIYEGDALRATYRHLSNSLWIVGEDAGNYTAVFSVEEGPYELAQNVSIIITILPAKSLMTLADVNATVNQKSLLTVNVTSYDRPVNGGIVSFYIDEGYVGNASVVNGSASLNYSFDKAGNHSLSAVCDAKNYLISNATSKVRVNKAESRIVFDEIVPVSYNSPTPISIKILSNGTEIHEGIVRFCVNGVEIKSLNVTESNTFYYLSPTAGTFDVVAVFGQSDNYVSSNESTTFTVKKSPTSIAASLAGGGGHIEITLTDKSGMPLDDVRITVRFSNGKLSAATVKNGKARVSTDGIVPAKKCTASIAFAGNVNYTQSAKIIAFMLKKQTPKIVAKSKTFKKSLKTKKYTIFLKTNRNKALSGVKVTLKVNKKTYSAKTKRNGQATFKITKLAKKGKFKAFVKFAGNTYYRPTSKSVKITVR